MKLEVTVCAGSLVGMSQFHIIKTPALIQRVLFLGKKHDSKLHSKTVQFNVAWLLTM